MSSLNNLDLNKRSLLQKSKKDGEALVERLFNKTLRLRWERSFSGALEEFVEALIYFELKLGLDTILESQLQLV